MFIIDTYIKQILGHQVSDHIRATANISAIKKAFKNFKPPSFYHSDREIQYTSKEYTKILEANGSKISMGIKAKDNAHSEIINRTTKEEYLSHWKSDNYNQLVRLVNKAVKKIQC
ncbi:MAG: DDE-type integrase/transposase/recombinase [Chitinophagales bacterium]